MHALVRKCLIGDQPRGVLEAERERQSPGTQPAQTDVGKCTKNPAQSQVLDGGMKKCKKITEKVIVKAKVM